VSKISNVNRAVQLSVPRTLHTQGDPDVGEDLEIPLVGIIDLILPTDDGRLIADFKNQFQGSAPLTLCVGRILVVLFIVGVVTSNVTGKIVPLAVLVPVAFITLCVPPGVVLVRGTKTKNFLCPGLRASVRATFC
jgi:hypothetical protein